MSYRCPGQVCRSSPPRTWHEYRAALDRATISITQDTALDEAQLLVMSGSSIPKSVLVPVRTLAVPCAWQVGSIVLHPGANARTLITNAPPLSVPDESLRDKVHEILDSCATSSIAVVHDVDDFNEALEVVAASLSALRLFQLSRRRSTETTFELPGELYSANFDYVAVADRSAPGFAHRGHHTGWTFSMDSYNDWMASPAFQLLSEALRDRDRTEGTRRAVTGMLLYDRAAMEHRPDLKMIGFASALEAWMTRRSQGSQTMRLARHVTWFGCGAHDDDLCGRSRPICPYLHLSPDRKSDRDRLKTLRDLGNTYGTWRCSEWHRVMDWYDARSDAAHGDPTAVDAKHASGAEFWISHYLAEPILLWLRDHPHDPVGELEAHLDSIQDPGNWAAMIAALDSSSPPAVPPSL